MFSKDEQIEILMKLGYTIEKESITMSRKTRIYGHPSTHFILIDGEKFEIEEVFKREMKKRIFDI